MYHFMNTAKLSWEEWHFEIRPTKFEKTVYNIIYMHVPFDIMRCFLIFVDFKNWLFFSKTGLCCFLFVKATLLWSHANKFFLNFHQHTGGKASISDLTGKIEDICQENYITEIYFTDQNCVLIFTVFLGLTQIFADLLTGSKKNSVWLLPFLAVLFHT